MKLSDNPALKQRRDRLARDLHRRRGGDYLDAVKEANATVLRGRRRAVTETAPRRPAKSAKKGGGRKAREARIREAVQKALSKVIAEAASPPRASAPAPAVPLTEMSLEELAAAITEASRAATSSARVTESVTAPEPAGAASEPAGPLHEMPYEDFEEHAADVLTGPNGTGLRSPFWAGADAPRSPFWSGL